MVEFSYLYINLEMYMCKVEKVDVLIWEDIIELYIFF